MDPFSRTEDNSVVKTVLIFEYLTKPDSLAAEMGAAFYFSVYLYSKFPLTEPTFSPSIWKISTQF